MIETPNWNATKAETSLTQHCSGFSHTVTLKYSTLVLAILFSCNPLKIYQVQLLFTTVDIGQTFLTNQSIFEVSLLKGGYFFISSDDWNKSFIQLSWDKLSAVIREAGWHYKVRLMHPLKSEWVWKPQDNLLKLKDSFSISVSTKHVSVVLAVNNTEHNSAQYLSISVF